MVENYTKDIKESVYHGAVISGLAIGYTMLGKTLIKINNGCLYTDTEYQIIDQNYEIILIEQCTSVLAGRF